MAKGWRPAWELELETRAINATDWAPLPGMVKRPCDWCRYFFGHSGLDVSFCIGTTRWATRSPVPRHRVSAIYTSPN